MSWQVLFDAVASLGMPVAVATALIWHFIWQSRNQDRHNRQLMEELAKLRESMARMSQTGQQDEYFRRENQKLNEAIRSREASSFDLARQLISLRMEAKPSRGSPAGTGATPEEPDGDTPRQN